MCQSREIEKGGPSTLGQKANLRLGLYKCPSCGAEIEIFSDECQVRCCQCGEMVYREKMSPCIEWCASASECLGKKANRSINKEVR